MLDMKAVFEALLPPGSLWEPAPLLGFDQFLTALGKNANDVYEQMYELGNLRDPRTTPVLSDLEKEYGILTKTNLSEAVRRQQLAAIKYARPGTASDTDLQTILRNAGFDVYVRRNHPPVDPADILATDYLLEAGEVDAFAGEPNAIAGLSGGELLVNGTIVRTSVDYEAQANGAAMFADEPTAIAGYFTDVTYTPVTYSIPVSSDLWPWIFFVTGQEWGWLNDWNAEYATTGQWENGTEGELRKNTDASFINSGIRSFELFPTIDTTITIIDPLYVNSTNMLTSPILNSCTVSGFLWGEDGPGQIEPIVYYYDPVLDLWIEGARGATNDSNAPFSFSTPNGISGIRLGAENPGPFATGNPISVYFDNILIEIDDVQRAEVPAEREKEFKELILKYKPLGTWAGLLVDYV
jgi:uncharacterized protein YmfQ (DUF2313 family)